MREEETKFGTRAYYDAVEVPAVIDEAREMFWWPFVGWRARLRISPFEGGHRYSLDFRVNGRWVFDGRDDDVTRLLDAFQEFLDDCRDEVGQPRRFARRCHSRRLQAKNDLGVDGAAPVMQPPSPSGSSG